MTIKHSIKTQRWLSTLALLFSLAIAHAQSRDTIRLWTGKVPHETQEKHAPVLSDNTKGKVCRVAQVTDPALVVYRPEQQNDSGMGIIVCPGGGYSILAIDKEGYEVAEWLNTLGITAFVLQYRVPKNPLGALNDIQRAIRIIRNEASEYQINADKIGIIGFSAGGSLCARAATMFSTDSYEKTDHHDTLSCRPDFAMLIYPAYLDRGENRSLTPELEITENTPPFFIFGTVDDKYGNSSLVMTTALRDHQIPVELHLLAKGGHGYGLRPGNVAAETWPSLAQKWLEVR